MTTATLGRDPFMPSPPKGRGPALALALLAHALLIAALAFGVHWRNSEPTTMPAELWSAVPQAAAPRAVEPAPTAPPTRPPKLPQERAKPEPAVRRAEPVAPAKPPTAALPDPQIAIEKARREAVKREVVKREEAEREQVEREKAERKQAQAREALASKKANEDRLKAATEKTQREKAEASARVEKAEQAAKAEQADAARLAAAREANLKRMLGQAGATGGATDTGSATRSSGPSASYAGRIMARIKPNIVFGDTVDGNPMATVEVKLAPDGTIVARRLVKSSGVKAWDEAVLRAIDRTEILPRDIDGRVPPPFPIDFRLRD
jgi:colicin import membrane protein